MFRKFILKRCLIKLAKLLIKRYGIKQFYTIGQINTTINKYNLKNNKYFNLLFMNEDDYFTVSGFSNYTEYNFYIEELKDNYIY